MEIGKKKSDSVLVDKSFSSEDASSCSLLIQCNKDCLRFVVASQDDLKLLALGTYFIRESEEIVDLIERVFAVQEMFSLEFAQAHAFFNGVPCTLVPSSIYSVKDNENILKTNYSQYDGELKSALIASITAYLVYAEPTGFSDVVHKKIPFCSVENSFPTLLGAVLSDAHGSKLKSIHVEVSDSFFECIVQYNGQLLLHNWFDIGGENDLLYHLLNICQQLNMNPQELKLEVYGHISKGDVCHSLLSKYFSKIDLGEKSLSNFSISGDNNDLSPYVSLLKILPCV